jgi:predicted nucleotidyltransferase
MRKFATLNALFPAVRGEILAACLLQPKRWWYLSELAAHLRTTPSSLQREVTSLTKAGILLRRRDGNRLYLSANQEAPIYPELRGLMEKTAGLMMELQLLLEPFREKISCAFVFGSLSRGTENAGSDVDLMIVGEVGLFELSPRLRKLERKIGREINAVVFGAHELRAKSMDHFVGSVLASSKKFVIGSDHELDAIIGESRGAKAPHVQRGTG